MFNTIFFFAAQNKITSIGGIAFAYLPRLDHVDLSRNICANKVYKADHASAIFRRRISRKCAPADETFKKEILCKASFVCEFPEKQAFFLQYRRISNCCYLGAKTRIDSLDYAFDEAKNYSDIELFQIKHQSFIEYLPVSVHKSIPNLKYYSISHTPIHKITKKNFEKMYELGVLSLDNNRIETIRSDTFQDLIKLVQISISMFADILGS